jgi:uncharacterized membrane protein
MSMPQITLTGHPLHPQLIVMPAGLLPFSLLLDVFHIKTRDQSFADAAYYTMMAGFVGGIAAGAAGAADYGTIPGDSQAKQIGRLHGLMNVGLLALTGLNLLMRRKRRSPSPLRWHTRRGEATRRQAHDAGWPSLCSRKGLASAT